MKGAPLRIEPYVFKQRRRSWWDRRVDIPWGLIIAGAILTWLTFAVVGLARAHGTHEFAQLTPEEQRWMGEALTTERSRPGLAAKGFTWHSCCNHGDRVKARMRSVKGADGYADEWYYEKDGEWIRIPDDVIHMDIDEEADAARPTPMSPQLKQEGVLFIYQGTITCFWPPKDGG